MRTMITPPKLAEQWGVSTSKVVVLIKTGQLEAVNLATSPDGKRPRYAISLDAIERFKTARRVLPELPTTPRLRRKSPAGVTQYF